MNSRLRASSMWLTAFNFFTLAELFSDVTVDVLCDAFTAAVPAVVDWSPAAGASPLAAVSCWSDWVVVTGMTSAASDFLSFSVAFTAGTASSPAFLSLLTVAVVEAGVLWVSSLIFCFQKRENGYCLNKSNVWTYMCGKNTYKNSTSNVYLLSDWFVLHHFGVGWGTESAQSNRTFEL